MSDRPAGDEHMGLWVYCTQHLHVHSTGWCTVPPRYKVALKAKTCAGACKEAIRRKVMKIQPAVTTYWYLKFDGQPVWYTNQGGLSVPKDQPLVDGACWDITHFKSLQIAKDIRAYLCRSHTKAHFKKFKIVKVTRKST